MKATKHNPGKLRRKGKYDNEPSVMKKILTLQDEVSEHLARNNRTLEEEFVLVLNKKSMLPYRLRLFIIQWVEFQYYQKQLNEQNEESKNQGESANNVRSDLPDELHPGE